MGRCPHTEKIPIIIPGRNCAWTKWETFFNSCGEKRHVKNSEQALAYHQAQHRRKEQDFLMQADHCDVEQDYSNHGNTNVDVSSV